MAGPWEEYAAPKTSTSGPWSEYANAEPVSRTERFVQGMRDPIDGGAQLLTKALPSGVVEAGNKLNNWLADKTGLVAKLPDGGVDQMVREREQSYQQRRKASGEEGFDGWRFTGSVAPSLLLPAARATTLGGQVALGSAAGAVSGAAAPVTSGDYWAEKGKQVATGAAFGAAAPVAMKGLGRLISPKASTNPAVQGLLDEGITPTPGQVLGGAAKATEEKLTSLPFVGDAVKGGQARAVGDLNRATANRALKPIGETLPKDLAGRDAVEYVETAIGKRYDKLLPSLTVRADSQFTNDTKSLSQLVKSGSIDPKYAKSFDRFMQSNVLGKFKGQNALTGQTLKDVESDLGQQASRLAQSPDPDARLLADAYREVQSNLRGLVERSNPQAAGELKSINGAYAAFKRLQRASSSVAAEDGVFSAAQLQSAVKALDRSKDKASFARGNALMQDLSEPAKAVLGNTIPNSGTADRGLMALLGALVDPRALAAAAVAPMAYSAPGQKALSAVLARRPDGAQAISNALQKASPSLGLLGGPVALQLGLE